MINSVASVRPGALRDESRAIQPVELPRLLIADYAIIVVFSCFVLSPFGWALFLNFQGNFYPEPVLGAVIVYVTIFSTPLTKMVGSVAASFNFKLQLVAVATLTVLGSLLTLDPVAAYSDARVLILMCFSYSAMSGARGGLYPRIGNIVFLCIIVSLTASVASVYLIKADYGSEKIQFPFLGFLFCTIWTVAKPATITTNVTLVLVASMSLLVAIIGSYRVYYALAAFNIMIALVGVFPRNRGALSASAIVRMASVIVILLGVAAYFDVIARMVLDYLSASQSRYGQTVAKWNELINSLQNGQLDESGETRIAYYSYIFAHPLTTALPSGLGQKAIVGNWGSLWSADRISDSTFSSKDGGFIYMIIHFGWCASAILIFRYLRSLAGVISFLRKGEFIVVVLGSISVFINFITTGFMFTQTSIAFATGAALGVLLKFPRSVSV